jgi:ABC-2 type transport system permease protein
MNPTLYAARLGLARGWAEFRQSLTDPQQLGFNVIFAVAFVIVLLFQRDSTVEGTNVSLAFAVLPGVLGMMVAVGGLQGAAGSLAVEREDGTLLRAKAVPNGMVGYLTGRVVSVSLGAILGLVIIFVPSLFLIPELTRIGLTGWLTFVWVLALGLLATLPIGAVIGSLAKSPNTVNGLVTLPIIGITAISGIFYPIVALPGWVQAIAQVFPIYWLGLGVRSAFLPDSAASVEIGESWRHLETVGVLGVWALVGLLLAPMVLRRMARKESGANMEARRPCCARSGASRAASSRRPSGSTTRRSATWSGASTAPASIWRCGSRSTSRCRWRWSSPPLPSRGSAAPSVRRNPGADRQVLGVLQGQVAPEHWRSAARAELSGPTAGSRYRLVSIQGSATRS